MEEQAGAKHLQYLAGVTAPVYWACTYAADVCSSLVASVVAQLAAVFLQKIPKKLIKNFSLEIWKFCKLLHLKI